jgi:hypothetical protein
LAQWKFSYYIDRFDHIKANKSKLINKKFNGSRIFDWVYWACHCKSRKPMPFLDSLRVLSWPSYFLMVQLYEPNQWNTCILDGAGNIEQANLIFEAKNIEYAHIILDDPRIFNRPIWFLASQRILKRQKCFLIE